MNQRNIEMLKAVLHLSQMPGYLLKLTVIENGHGRNKLKKLMPEVADYCAEEGDALYCLNYREGVDYKSDALERTVISECPDFSFVFINAGDDLLNLNIALQLRAIASARGRKEDNYTLQVSIVNKSILEKWNADLCRGIIPVGSLKETFDYGFVTNSDIESASEKIHLARHSSTPWISYLNNEYSRHSVFARTLSYRYKVQLLGDNYSLAGRDKDISWDSEDELRKVWDSMSDDEKLWKEYEHMRWNMYTRTLGYRADSEGLLTELAKEDERLLYLIREKKRELKELKSLSETGAAAGTEEGIQNAAAQAQELTSRIVQLNDEKKKNWAKVKSVRTTAQVHNDLIPFDKLSLAAKIKDNLELTDEVVEELRKINTAK